MQTQEWNPLVKSMLERVLNEPAGLAVFDADGTLWPMDAGDAFFHFLMRGNHLPKYPLGAYSNTYQHPVWLEYLHRCAINTLDGYFYIAALMEGMSENHLVELAQAFVLNELKGKVYQAQIELIQTLKAAGHRVCIVSASNRWLIEASAPLFGLQNQDVLAMDAEVSKGLLTATPKGPVVQGQGKMDKIRSELGHEPLLAVGNSHGDVAMFKAAKYALVIDSDHSSAPWKAFCDLHNWPIQRLNILG